MNINEALFLFATCSLVGQTTHSILAIITAGVMVWTALYYIEDVVWRITKEVRDTPKKN